MSSVLKMIGAAAVVSAFALAWPVARDIDVSAARPQIADKLKAVVSARRVLRVAWIRPEQFRERGTGQLATTCGVVTLAQRIRLLPLIPGCRTMLVEHGGVEMRWGHVFGLALLVLLFAGCSGDSDQALEDQLAEVTAERDQLAEQLAAAEATASGEPSDEMSTPAEAAIAYGTGSAEAFLVGARVNFVVPDQGTLTTDPDGTQHSRNGTSTATFVGNDPRITGSETLTWNSDRWGAGVHNGAITQWGTAVLETADGTWEGPFSGVFTTATTDVFSYWLTGTGDYEGWSMFMWTTESNQRGEGVVYGLIFPGDPPVGLEPGP